jgi:hypothetical protein
MAFQIFKIGEHDANLAHKGTMRRVKTALEAIAAHPSKVFYKEDLDRICGFGTAPLGRSLQRWLFIRTSDIIATRNGELRKWHVMKPALKELTKAVKEQDERSLSITKAEEAMRAKGMTSAREIRRLAREVRA